MTAGRDINSYLSSLPENTVSLQLSLKYTHCVKSPSKSDPLLLRVLRALLLKWKSTIRHRTGYNVKHVSADTYSGLCAFGSFGKAEDYHSQTPLELLLGGLSRRLSLYVYLPLDSHCTMPTEHNTKTYTPEERATKHTLKLGAPGVCLAPLKRLLNMSQLLCSGLQQQL